MIKQDISGNRANLIYLGIGSNLGNRIQNIEKAKYLLNTYGIKILKSSSYYETLSWPDPSQPKFFNIIIQSNTKFTLKKYLDVFKAIEKKLGRKKSIKNAAKNTLKKVKELGGSGGVIGIDKNLNIIMDFNTEGMYRGYMKSNGDSAIEIYK